MAHYYLIKWLVRVFALAAIDNDQQQRNANAFGGVYRLSVDYANDVRRFFRRKSVRKLNHESFRDTPTNC